jgi:hypothetical protein
MAKALTKAELRAALPKAPRWFVETLIAFERDGVSCVEIRSRGADFDAAILDKLSGDAAPWKPHGWKPNQSLKSAAQAALEDAVRPRRTGGTRGRPSLAPVIAAIEACFDGNYISEDGLRRVHGIVCRSLGTLTRGQRLAIMGDIESVTERQGRRVDWRAYLRKWRNTPRESEAD